ncbi:MAG TPA: flagellar basal-body rod protein FlgG, partial [Gammaproteobacteria bacterium]|nr:flagellar basal-body rod protein FlgG [Gammaproteobacteria bacterium]
GLAAQDTKMNVISNNLANVATTGFKKERAVFHDLLYQIKRQPGAASSQDTNLPSGLQQGTGVRTVATQKMFQMGALQITDNALDVAINGRGFLQIAMPDGSIGYTRDGELQIDETGQIVTSEGYVVQPAITLPGSSATVTISEDGVVTVVDGVTGQATQAGQFQLADFINPTGLQAIGGNLFKETTASGAPTVGNAGVNGMGRLLQGTLENSNVSVVEELVDMISTQRAYEMNSKVISTVDQMLATVSQNL